MKREEIVSLMESMEAGMIKTKTTKDIWQNDLVYALCYAVYYLLKDKLKAVSKNENQN